MKPSKTKGQGHRLAQNLADFIGSDGRLYNARYQGALLDQLQIAADELGPTPSGHPAPAGFTDWLAFVNAALLEKLTPADREAFQSQYKTKAQPRKRINSNSEALAAANILYALFNDPDYMGDMPSYQTLRQIETAIRVLDGQQDAITPGGFDNWRDFVCDALNRLPTELRFKALARLRMQRSRTKRDLVSLEIEAPTLTKLQEWQRQHDHRNLSQAIDALLRRVTGK